MASSDAVAKPLTGILKKTTASGAVAPRHPQERHAPPKSEAEQIARQHALIIQDRKELETQIFDNINELTEYPLDRGEGFSAALPAPRDVAGFKALIRLFQPSDYDDLIEERNCCGLCGYALCARPRVTFKGGGVWKLVNTGTKDFNIVERRELEKWCSQKCARRALYIKVQLNETAAWERAGIPDIEIELLDEEAPAARSEPERLAAEMGRLNLEQERKTAQDSASLALERGDLSKKQPRKPVGVTIREKKVTSLVEPPSLEDSAATSNIVEGHQTKFGVPKEPGE